MVVFLGFGLQLDQSSQTSATGLTLIELDLDTASGPRPIALVEWNCTQTHRTRPGPVEQNQQNWTERTGPAELVQLVWLC